MARTAVVVGAPLIGCALGGPLGCVAGAAVGQLAARGIDGTLKQSLTTPSGLVSLAVDIATSAAPGGGAASTIKEIGMTVGKEVLKAGAKEIGSAVGGKLLDKGVQLIENKYPASKKYIEGAQAVAQVAGAVKSMADIATSPSALKGKNPLQTIQNIYDAGQQAYQAVTDVKEGAQAIKDAVNDDSLLELTAAQKLHRASLQIAKRHENDTLTDEPMTEEQVREATAYILPFVRGYFEQVMYKQYEAFVSKEAADKFLVEFNTMLGESDDMTGMKDGLRLVATMPIVMNKPQVPISEGGPTVAEALEMLEFIRMQEFLRKSEVPVEDGDNVEFEE